MMAKHIVIERPNGIVTIVRSEIETPSEEPLTEHEQIINELYSKVKNLGLFSVVQQRELLKAFLEHIEETIDFLPCEPSELIDDYFKSLL